MAESERFLKVAVQAARAGGRILMDRLGKLTPSDVSRKGSSDWVTTVDHASERAILKVIRKVFPDHSVRAEETSPTASSGTYHWMIDPLDGTSNYIHRFPAFCVSVALAIKDRLEVGVVFDPLRQELFTARRGRGAFLNGRRIRVSSCRTMATSLIATGFPVRAKQHLDLYLVSFRRVFLKTGIIRRVGSAALDLSYTACGRADGFWELSLSSWDMAAGALLIQEAGGTVSDFFGGNSYLVSGHIAAGNPVIHARLTEIVGPVFRGKIT